MVPNTAALFLFFIGKPEDPEENPLLSVLLFLSFFLFSLLKKEKREYIRNKKENRKEKKRKKENRKRSPFFYCQQVSFFGCVFGIAIPNSGNAILCLRQSDTASFFSDMRHCHFLVLIQIHV